MSNNLRLSDLLTRSVAVEWYEAVALVREVTDRLLESSGAPIMPELDEIEMTADGGIAVLGGATTDEPVRRLGQLLQAVIVQSAPPVQLRLLIAQATAATPAFGSIREYSSALAYFERPNRGAVLQSLFARAAAAPAPESHLTPTLDAIAPLEAFEPEEVRGKKSGRTSSQRALWLAVCAVLLLMAGTAAYLTRGGDVSKMRDVSAIALNASDAVRSAVVSGISSVTGRAERGQPAQKDSSGAVLLTAAAPVQRGRVPTLVRKASALRKPEIPKVVFDLDPSPVVEEAGTSLAIPKLRALLTTMSSPAPLIGAADASEKSAKADLTVYSQASAGVVPPIGIGPQLPRELPANVDKSQLGRIELIVLPDGTVGSVKLLNRPHNVHESMFLSAVKAWEFRPAIKDGRPVTYRKIVWMAFQ